MFNHQLEHRLGKVTLSPPGPVVAGTVGSWQLVYTVGSYGVDEGGTIKIARRFASDWQRPQFDRPSEPGYTTVATTGEAKLQPRFDPKGHVRPWMKCVVIDVYDGSLTSGDVVSIMFGDTRQGSPGIRAQSFQESAHEIRFLVDPTNACLVRRLPSSPVFAVLADEPVKLVLIVPTQAAIDQWVKIFVKGEDEWGNPTSRPDDVSLSWDGDAVAKLNGDSLRFTAEGSGRVTATFNGKTYASNPITCTTNEPRWNKYWGDLHAQTDATVGTGTEEEYFRFGRDWARLDFTSHQGNDFQMTDADWKRLNDVVQEFHEDDQFVVFPGYEWSANTTAGGDRNVFYLEEGLPILRSSHWQTTEIPEDDRTPAHPADELFRSLRKQVDLNKVLVASHVGGRYADIRQYMDEELAPLVEITSCWGVFEWMLWDAFDKGYRVGVMCNSDGHKGRPGAEGPGAGDFGIGGGLTCVLAESLTRRAVFDALKQRRCYGTTGPRIDLSFMVDGHPMGSSTKRKGMVHVDASVNGTAPLESLLLFRGREIVDTVRSTAFDQCHDSRRCRIAWSGARIRGRGRRAVWDGTVEVRGARIEQVRTFAFDSPADGIVNHDDRLVHFRSRTTGDVDGLDLWLDQAQSGQIHLRSAQGELVVDLDQLDSSGCIRQFGGLELKAEIQRYPETLAERSLVLQCQVDTLVGQTTPFFVKAIQEDGHMAWASPVYVD